MKIIYNAGFAQLDVTPEYPVRLSGYGARREESAETYQRLWAKALVFGIDTPVVLIAVDNCGVSQDFTESVATAITEKWGIPRARVVLCFTHTHGAPCLTGVLTMLFSSDIPRDHQSRIDRYTDDLRDKILQVVDKAFTNRDSSTVSWARGMAGFAANRRSQIGPVDHVMPVLRVESNANDKSAVWLSYSCHCTTMTGESNLIGGDWAGFAQEYIQDRHPDTTAFVTIGCAADANPFPRSSLSHTKQHGKEIAEAVDRVRDHQFNALSEEAECRLQYVELPYDIHPTLEEWRQKARGTGPVAYHAKKWLECLESGQTIPESYSYSVQTWTFGSDLAMVFLAGEVVSDYAMRLRKVFDPERVWLGAYANALPGYIPSRRIWREGGYEGEGATVYFGLPNRFAEDNEDRIVSCVEEMMPSEYRLPD